MQTNFSAQLLATESGARANDILRSCVHCGFCNATCPTYQLTGDELDGPRGRIYLIRELLETGSNRQRASYHLDRCLTCRACETTCPSGVQYGELAEIARHELGPQRRGWAGLLRRGLQWLIPAAPRLRRMALLGRWFRWCLPTYLADQVPVPVGHAPDEHPGQPAVLLLNGCAQQVATAATNHHLTALLAGAGFGVRVAANEGCCGALDLHLGDESTAMARIKANIDAIFPLLADVQAVISSASGCGVTVKDYARLLATDSNYADKARQLTEKTLDVSEFLQQQPLRLRATKPLGARVAWHAPCSLQHGQQLSGSVERLLTSAGYDLLPVADSHICCGSAGTYSILQPQMAARLKAEKLATLQANEPDYIVTANVGCQTHLHNNADVEVLHWVQLLTVDDAPVVADADAQMDLSVGVLN